jgi:two-component system, NarL family, nitrate/nitrite response regulator NarL
VLLASGDRLFASAARAYLERHGWRVVATVEDGLQALASIGRHTPGALLVLGELPRLATPALARQVRRRWPSTAVVALGGSPAAAAMVLPLRAGADAVLAALGTRPPPTEQVPEERPDGVRILRRLTSRERLILKLLAEGLSVRDIARRLDVSQHTIRTHMQNLYAKLGAHSRLDVVRFAAQHGLVPSEDGGR